ncbi:MAG: hypothetical protein A3F43_01940 [Gammaproteobacteria bacterium RIFCSPHIGHO2_12_FULL_42_10]|nr:MAG: hypothetical protein A3F43_01940 [Gammaproteobacteria bacterium RIFCSPHIGHO2_12_FULL_42_10]
MRSPHPNPPPRGEGSNSGVVVGFVIYFFSILLTGCAVGPDFHEPIAPQVSSYTESPLHLKTVGDTQATRSADHAQSFDYSQTLEGQWWRMFRSSAINALVNRGVQNSPNLLAAEAKLKEAQETLSALKGSLLLPSFDLAGSAERQRFSNSTIDQSGSSVFNLFNVSINVAYTFDIFGGVRRQIESAAAAVDYERFIMEGAYLALTSNIVTTAITLASIQSQILATDKLIHIQSETLRLMEKQLQLGGIAHADILSQEDLLAATRALKPPLEKNLFAARHALSILMGDLPSEGSLPNIDLDQLTLPKRLPITLPSKLVETRPDIKAQSALLHEASAAIGIATANLLPNVTLSAGNGWISPTMALLFSTPVSGTWNLGTAFAQPIYRGGALMATRRAKIAAYVNAAMLYRQTVLQAFANVADSLRAIDEDARAFHEKRLAESASRESWRLTGKQYQLGAVSYLTVLSSEVQYRKNLIARIQSEALRYNDTVALFQSLGGSDAWHS